MNPRLNAVLAFLVSAWLVNVLLPAPAYSFENSTEGLQAEVELLNTKIAELQMTVSAMMTQLSTLSTAVITLQTHSMTGANGSPSALASIPTKATDAGSAKEPISGQAMLVTPQKLEESSLGRQMVDYRFLGYLYQSGTQRAFIGRGRDIFIVSVGEIVDNALEVLAIDPSGIKVRDTRSQAEMTLSQSKAKPGAS